MTRDANRDCPGQNRTCGHFTYNSDNSSPWSSESSTLYQGPRETKLVIYSLYGVHELHTKEER